MADDQTKVVNPREKKSERHENLKENKINTGKHDSPPAGHYSRGDSHLSRQGEKKSGRPGNLKEKKIDTGKHDSPPAGHYSRGDSHLSRQGRKLWN
ncbi:hypothetical protein GH714_008204 [Hevea brasiliensis]|uniref:Uncharacterized protein n=1 Tax=Hevea brasiliensis TaxID=3981 RepID=A0A6A6LWI2_HEVBR|nr:hypothetical protein GH714_008204 [Hevea brasiliensis]